jgi:curved DNA-binding protein CbpA
MTRTSLDPYLVLGVLPTATQAEITHAYRTRLRAHHPDTRNAPSSLSADEHLREVLAAYALLRDPARRAEYDDGAARVDAARVAGPPLDDSDVSITVSGPPVGGVQIPVTYRRPTPSAARNATPPLWAGPVRRHDS